MMQSWNLRSFQAGDLTEASVPATIASRSVQTCSIVRETDGSGVTTDLIADALALGSDPAVIVVTVLTLVAFIITKETVTSVGDRRGQAVGKVLDVVLVPLLLVFAVVLAVRV
jgi:hypothetical protein